MKIEDLKRIISSFADRSADIEIERGQLLSEIRGEVITADIKNRDGDLSIKEDSQEVPVRNWIRDRLACLPLLAERILDYVPEDKNFIDPYGNFLDRPDISDADNDKEVHSCVNKLSDVLPCEIPDISNVVYLTSDAGEGKTTLINQLARIQALKFKRKESDWLLVPIPLGGRPFLRFDDVVVASLVNKLRFRYFYYDSFIELVKLGMIIPAFDGFEEMFMQNSAGEALTATGELINRLESQGSILIAARKAYFDYKSFKTQAKLYDSIHGSVSFSRLAVKRWGKEQFIEYAKNRKIDDPTNVFEIVAKGLRNEEHPILTRPVLAKQLIDVMKESGDIDSIVSKLGSTVDYFPLFVNAIIEREATQKWIDTSGEPYKPILTVEQHYDLLATLAEEMWLNSTDSIRDNVLDLLIELYSEQIPFNAQTTRQIKERIKQHALLIRPNSEIPMYQFDHEEFFFFFLGILIADKILNHKRNDVKNILRKGILREETFSSIVYRVKRNNNNISETTLFLEDCMKGEGQFSYLRENISNIVIKVINDEAIIDSLKLQEYLFTTNAFLNISINNISFENCYIQTTSLMGTKMDKCQFKKCQFDRLEFENNNSFNDIIFENCDIAIVYDNIMDKGYYDYCSIKKFLESKDIIVKDSCDSIEIIDSQDEDLELTEKALRRFIRSNTPINDRIFLIRLGNKADYFMSTILKDLKKRDILIEVGYIGQGQKRRFKLGVSYSRIEDALSKSKGKYQNFLDYFSSTT